MSHVIRLRALSVTTWSMGVLLLAYLAGLLLPGGQESALVNRWLGLLTFWVPAAVCWLAAWTATARPAVVRLTAIGVTSYAVGNTYYVSTAATGGSLPFPSPADLGYLGFVPFMVAALVAGMYHRAPGQARFVWLDAVVGTLGAAAVLAVVLEPELKAATTGPPSLASAVAIAYPLSDVLLLSAIGGIAALGARRLGPRWPSLVAGLLVFAATDVIYAAQTASDTYLSGTLLDAGWAIGLALMAWWVVAASEREVATLDGRPTERPGSLVVATLATATAIGVLVVGARATISTLALVLAGLTLLAGVLRTHLSFRMLSRNADLRRQAATDDLTGLPNRRHLYVEGTALLRGHPIGAEHSCCSTSTGSRRSTTASGTTPATSCWSRSLPGCGSTCAPATCSRGSAATSSPSCSTTRAGSRRRRWPRSCVRALDRPFVLEGLELSSGVSIGISLFPEDGSDLTVLLRKADIAMYRAKGSGIGIHTYGGDDDAASALRLQSVQELRSALAAGELVLHYQPKVDLGTGEVHGVEALVRWDHPTRGLLQPAAFLGLVEHGGLMPAMTTAVLALALEADHGVDGGRSAR